MLSFTQTAWKLLGRFKFVNQRIDGGDDLLGAFWAGCRLCLTKTERPCIGSAIRIAALAAVVTGQKPVYAFCIL